MCKIHTPYIAYYIVPTNSFEGFIRRKRYTYIYLYIYIGIVLYVIYTLCFIGYCTKLNVQELIKIAGDKIQTSLWLDRDVKRLIEDEGLNLSKWVNTNILISLSVEHEDEILRKIKDHEGSIKTLKSRLKALRERNKGKSQREKIMNAALDELRHGYTCRADEGQNRENNLIWIRSPKNIGRCKLLEKLPDEMLNELEAWYNGSQKSNV